MSRPTGKSCHRTLKQKPCIQYVPKSLHDGLSLQLKLYLCEVTVPHGSVGQYPRLLHTHLHECPVAVHLLCSLQEVASISPHGCVLLSHYGGTWAGGQKGHSGQAETQTAGTVSDIHPESLKGTSDHYSEVIPVSVEIFTVFPAL